MVRRDAIPRLPDAELEVLAHLQQRGESTAADLRTALERQRPMTHGSMMTLLGRLEEKRLVARRKADEGRAFVYRPTRQAATTLRKQPARLLQRVFSGDLLLFVSSLLDSRPPTHDELDELQSLLDSLRESGGGRRKADR